MKLLIDMNLSPRWVRVFQESGIKAVHWSSIGAGDAADREIMQYAAENDFCIFTHDLDFTAILAASNAAEPSVIQIRSDDVSPEAIAELLLLAIQQHETALDEGALLTLDPSKARVRILPLK